MRKLKIGEVYKHYKGTKVKVLGEALHSETMEPMVVYLHLEDGIVWVRPKKMFLENVILDGKKQERFKLINQKNLIKPGR
jgi:hypothetical protein